MHIVLQLSQKASFSQRYVCLNHIKATKLSSAFINKPQKSGNMYLSVMNRQYHKEIVHIDNSMPQRTQHFNYASLNIVKCCQEDLLFIDNKAILSL